VTASSSPLIRFSRLDPEARLGLPVGSHTTPSTTTCVLLTTLIGGAIYGASFILREGEWGAVVWQYLTGFGRLPIPTTLFSIWSLVFLTLKAFKIRAQRAALRIHFVPDDTAFLLSAANADSVVDAIDRAADDPSRFIFLARARSVLRIMRNLGRVSDVDDIIASRGEQDEATIDSGYTILRGLIWAIPVLGFIGTVIGLTQAMGRFGTALRAAGKDVESITQQLTGVLAGLDTAFITTAEALIAVIFIYLIQTAVRRADEELLDDVNRACFDAIVSRVRITRQEP
jgi:biopolymer transport protein ExbB/TolQ